MPAFCNWTTRTLGEWASSGTSSLLARRGCAHAHATGFKNRRNARSFPSRRSASDRNHRLQASPVRALLCLARLRPRASTRAQARVREGRLAFRASRLTGWRRSAVSTQHAGRRSIIADRAFTRERSPKPPLLSVTALLVTLTKMNCDTLNRVNETRAQDPHSSIQAVRGAASIHALTESDER